MAYHPALPSTPHRCDQGHHFLYLSLFFPLPHIKSETQKKIRRNLELVYIHTLLCPVYATWQSAYVCKCLFHSSYSPTP